MATVQSALDLKLAMASTNELFTAEVIGKRNFDALDATYTVDARILPPGAELISGRGAIKEFWSNLVQSANAKSAVLESVDVMPSGDGAVEIRARQGMDRTRRRGAERARSEVCRLLAAGR